MVPPQRRIILESCFFSSKPVTHNCRYCKFGNIPRTKTENDKTHFINRIAQAIREKKAINSI